MGSGLGAQAPSARGARRAGLRERELESLLTLADLPADEDTALGDIDLSDLASTEPFEQAPVARHRTGPRYDEPLGRWLLGLFGWVLLGAVLGTALSSLLLLAT